MQREYMPGTHHPEWGILTYLGEEHAGNPEQHYPGHDREPQPCIPAASECGGTCRDGRRRGRAWSPAWLRDWFGEEHRPIAFQDGATDSAEIRPDESAASNTPADTASAYAGQSIEAALAYETVFHFDTELEAESTEDWLDLSAGTSQENLDQADSRPGLEVEASQLTTGVRHLEIEGADLHASVEEATTRQGDHGLSGRMNGVAAAAELRSSATSIDPKAVRAAIFRLSQESPNRWQPGDRRVAVTEEVAPVALKQEELATSGTEQCRPPSPNFQADFAEVAHRVWVTERSANDGPLADTDGRIQTECLEGPALPEAPTGISLLPEVEVGEARGTELLQSSSPDEEAVFAPSSAIGESYTTATQEPVSTAMAHPGSQSDAKESAAAGGAPALAHDAGNLLSALKLYSELLALSGVLQARHSHYAEDLKLLAARSEVLIHRLLQSFTFAEHENRIRKAHEHSFETAAPVVHDEAHGTQGLSDHAMECYFAKSIERPDQSPVSASLAPATELLEVGRPDPEESKTTRQPALYWTDERLSAIHDEIGKVSEKESEAFVKPTLKANAIGARTVAAASSCEDAMWPQSRPVARGTELLEETSPVEAARTGSSNKAINLVELLTRWGGLLSMIARSPVQVNFGPHASLPVQVGEEALERILVNLVHNSMEATRNGGSVRIGVGRPETRRLTLLCSASGDTRPANKMVLTVDDSGCGMTEQQVARALGIDSNPVLHRASHEAYVASTPRHRGHGMGLQIVRELVASSGGELSIYSRRGAGTRIEIQWPLLLQRIEDEGSPQRISPASAVSVFPGSNSQASIQPPLKNLQGAIAC